MHRRTEIHLQRFAARGTLNLHQIRRHPESARQCSVVELQHEITTTILVRRDRTCDVVSPELIRYRLQTLCGYHAHARQAGFAIVLTPISIGVVENLSRDVGAIERWVGDDTHGSGGL